MWKANYCNPVLYTVLSWQLYSLANNSSGRLLSADLLVPPSECFIITQMHFRKNICGQKLDLLTFLSFTNWQNKTHAKYSPVYNTIMSVCAFHPEQHVHLPPPSTWLLRSRVVNIQRLVCLSEQCAGDWLITMVNCYTSCSSFKVSEHNTPTITHQGCVCSKWSVERPWTEIPHEECTQSSVWSHCVYSITMVTTKTPSNTTT